MSVKEWKGKATQSPAIVLDEFAEEFDIEAARKEYAANG